MYLFIYSLVFIYGLYQRRSFFVYDYVFLIFIFTGLYVLIPLLVIKFGTIPALLLFRTTTSSIEYLISYSEYFLLIISGCTYLWLLLTKNSYFYFNKNLEEAESSASIKNLIPLFFILVIAQFFIFILIAPDPFYMWSDRVSASQFKTDFNSIYKTQFLFFLLSFLVVLAICKTRNMKYLLFLLPYLIMDIYSGDRSFLFQFFMLWCVSNYSLNKKIPLFQYVFIPLLMLLIEVIRGYIAGWQLSAANLIPGEVLNSYTANFIILDSGDVLSVKPLLLKILLPDILVDSLYPGNKNFGLILSENSTLNYGLGGSILAEPLSLNSNFWAFLYPFLLFFYGMVIVYIHRSLPLTLSIIVYTVAYLTLHTLFRGGVFYSINVTIYYLVIAFAFFQLLKFVPTKSVKLNSYRSYY